MLLKVTSIFACAEIANKTMNHSVCLDLNDSKKQQHKGYSCRILKGLRPSDSVSLYKICAGTASLSTVVSLVVGAFDLVNCSLSVVGFLAVFNVGQVS